MIKNYCTSKHGAQREYEENKKGPRIDAWGTPSMRAVETYRQTSVRKVRPEPVKCRASLLQTGDQNTVVNCVKQLSGLKLKNSSPKSP